VKEGVERAQLREERDALRRELAACSKVAAPALAAPRTPHAPRPAACLTQRAADRQGQQPSTVACCVACPWGPCHDRRLARHY